MTVAETQIKDCHYRVKAARAKIRKLSKQIVSEKEAIEFWRHELNKPSDNRTLIEEAKG